MEANIKKSITERHSSSVIFESGDMESRLQFENGSIESVTLDRKINPNEPHIMLISLSLSLIGKKERIIKSLKSLQEVIRATLEEIEGTE